jgi:signal transduction histidine kinase/ligand-binding sensor domain-containing protein
MSVYRVSIIIFLFILALSLRSEAQRFPFFNLKVENGLVQSQATSLTQDPLGNLWIGTLGGLSRYDGKRVVNYTVSDGLLSNTIVNVQASGSGSLYVSTAEGFQVFDGNRFREIKNQKNESFKAVNQVVLSGTQKAYLLLNTGFLYRLDCRQSKSYAVPLKERLLTVHCKNNVLRVASEDGVIYVLDEQNEYAKTDSFRSADPQLRVLKIFEDSKGKCWLLCNKGLYLLQDRSIIPFVAEGTQKTNMTLLNAAEDHEGQLWLASSSGIFRKDGNRITHFDHESGLTNNIVWDVLCDKEGNMWISSDGEGLFRYSGGPFVSIGESSGLINKQVTGIAGDRKGTMYFSSYEGRLYSYLLGAKVTGIPAPELHNDAITGIVWQQGAGLWVSTRNMGLFRMQEGHLKQFDLSPYGSKQVNTLYTDSRNRIFAGLREGMLCIDKGVPAFYQLKGVTPVSCTEIGDDSILIAAKDGFWLLHNGNTTPWNRGSFTDSIPVQCMCSDGNNLYIGTSEGGIVVYDMVRKRRSILNSKNGLSSDFIYNIIRDARNNTWAGTGRGICKITKTKDDKFSIRIYGKDNGVIGLESNSNASFADNDGRIWFGTTEGVSCYSPEARPVSAHPSHIVLESVKLFGGKDINPRFFTTNAGWYNIPDQLRLPYKYNNVSFSFQAITLSPVDKILYRYILEGSGRNWSEWSEENTINFLGLEPAVYTLKVMCKINGVAQKHVMLSYSFTIKTPFHKSIWFVISIFVLAILFGVYLQYAANKRKLKRQLREDALRKEEQSRVRERTAEDFHDEVGNKLTRINVLTSVLKSKLGSSANAEAGRIIQQIQDNSQQLYAGTRDILWSLQPSNDNLYEIINHVRDLAAELFSETEIRFAATGNDDSFREYKMPLDKSRNFIMIWKEALNNSMKYASASKVLLQVSRSGDAIQVRLVDNGVGFDPATVQQGNGLKNMQTRATRLDAGFEILSSRAQGTQVILTLKDNNK